MDRAMLIYTTRYEWQAERLAAMLRRDYSIAALAEGCELRVPRESGRHDVRFVVHLTAQRAEVRAECIHLDPESTGYVEIVYDADGKPLAAFAK